MVEATRTWNRTDERSILRVYANSGVLVEDVRAYLLALEFAYNSALVLEKIVDKAQMLQEIGYPPVLYSNELWGQWWSPNPEIVSSLVPDEDKLIFHSVRIESPGFWDFLGTLNPLEVIRQYLIDRHERKKDEVYREREEAKRLALQNELLMNEVISQRISILKDLGVPLQELSLLKDGLLRKPLGGLDEFQDKGLITVAEVMELALSEEDKPVPL